MAQSVRSLGGGWRAAWNDFRMAPWLEIVEYPEYTLQQTQQILSFAN